MKRVYLTGLALLSITACDNAEPLAPSETFAIEEAVLAGSPEESLDKIASAFATAISDASVRSDVRDAMRASPWGQHVLDVGDFVSSTLGAATATQMETALGLNQQELSGLINSLPALDLYIPHRAARQTWRGSGDVVVYASFDYESEPVHKYSAGGALTLNPPSYFEAVFMIEPAGRRILRYDRDAGNDPMVVEGPDEITIYYKFTDADGAVTEGTYVDIVREAERRSGAMAAPSSNGDTDILHISANFCDGVAGMGGDLEIRLESEFYDETGALIGTAEHYDGSVPSDPGCNHDMNRKTYSSPYPTLIDYVLSPGAAHHIDTQMWEDDAIQDDSIGADGITVGDDWFVFGSNCSTTDCGETRVTYSTISSSTLTTVTLPPLVAEIGEGAESATATLFDQYGFGLLTTGYSATGWGTNNSSIATASGVGGVSGDVSPVAVGTTTYYATVSGVQGSASVTVQECEECH